MLRIKDKNFHFSEREIAEYWVGSVGMVVNRKYNNNVAAVLVVNMVSEYTSRQWSSFCVCVTLNYLIIS